jgi:hypothetical protein
MTSEYGNQIMILSPVELGSAPPVGTVGGAGTYAPDAAVVHDDPRSFEKLQTFVGVGFILATEDGFELATDKYRVALAPGLTDPIRAILTDRALSAEDRALFENREVPIKNKTSLYEKRLRLYLTLGEQFPWTLDGKPGRRQLTRQIGEARVDGVLLGKIYVVNRGEPATPQS